MKSKSTIIKIYIVIILTGFLFLEILLSYRLLIMTKTNSVSYLKNKQDESTMTVISLEELQDIINGKNEGLIYIYIGRDSCPECHRFYPQLCEVLEQNNINIIYYSTEPDRNERPDEMNKILNTIDVEKVPAVVEIEDDQIKNIFDGDSFLEYMECRGD